MGPTQRRGMYHPRPRIPSDWLAPLKAQWSAHNARNQGHENGLPTTQCVLVVGAEQPELVQRVVTAWQSTITPRAGNWLTVFSLCSVASRSAWRASQLPLIDQALDLDVSNYHCSTPSHTRHANTDIEHILWWGEPLALMGHINGSFDAVICTVPPSPWLPKAMAKVLKKNGLLVLTHPEAHSQQTYATQGFSPVVDSQSPTHVPPKDHQVTPPDAGCAQWWKWDAAWIKTPRLLPARVALPTVAVIGAGLAGAVTAWAFARRGWHVVVFEKEPSYAMGASGLPVGLVCPQLQTSDPVAELTRIGVATTFNLCQQLLTEGVDFKITGVQTHFSSPDGLHKKRRQTPNASIALAGWVKPMALIEACLQHPLIRVVSACQVTSVETSIHPGQSAPHWLIHSPEGVHHCGPKDAPIGFDALVLANAMGVRALSFPDGLTPTGLTLQTIAGQLSYGAHASFQQHAIAPDDCLPLQPHNGAGHLLPSVPTANGNYWFAGASYRLNSTDCRVSAADGASNLAKATALWPAFAQLTHLAMETEVEHWTGVRCAPPDRAPLVGEWATDTINGHTRSPLMMIGFGSRGLSLAPLCAHMVLSLITQTPSPVPKRLMKRLAPSRYISKSLYANNL